MLNSSVFLIVMLDQGHFMQKGRVHLYTQIPLISLLQEVLNAIVEGQWSKVEQLHQSFNVIPARTRMLLRHSASQPFIIELVFTDSPKSFIQVRVVLLLCSFFLIYCCYDCYLLIMIRWGLTTAEGRRLGDGPQKTKTRSYLRPFSVFLVIFRTRVPLENQ